MSAESASAIQKSQVDLLDSIDWSGLECLNQSSSHALSNALKQVYREDDGLHLESDADEQLLLYIPFTQVVKLHSFAIKAPEKEGPKTVELFSNKEPVGFSLTVFIEDNQTGSEITKVQKIKLYGTTMETTDMKGLKKIEDQ